MREIARPSPVMTGASSDWKTPASKGLVRKARLSVKYGSRLCM